MEHPSLPDFLRKLETDELLVMADRLRDLTGHPGWESYQQLLRVQRDKVNYQMVHSSLRDVQSYAHAGGHIKGLEQALEVVQTALRIAEAVEAQLAAEAVAAGG